MLLYSSLIDDEGQRSKFEKLYYEYRAQMKYYAQMFLQDEQLAEDAVHEAFIKIARHMDKIRDVSCQKTYSFVTIILKNICKDILRTENKYNFISYDEEFDQIYMPNSKIKNNFDEIEFSALVDEIKNLPDLYKDALLLKFYYGYSDREIADLFKISYSAARKRVERARELLSRALEKGEDC